MHESAPTLVLSVLRQQLRASSTSTLLQLSLVFYIASFQTPFAAAAAQ